MMKRNIAQMMLSRIYEDWCCNEVEPLILKEISLNKTNCYIDVPDYMDKNKLEAELEYNGYDILDKDPCSNLPVPSNNILISWA